MTLRLRNYGIATAYATVGVGDVIDEMNDSRAAAKEYEDAAAERAAKAAADGKPSERQELWPPELLFILGQADIATIYKTKNFKRIFELRYPRASSHATGVNWVFSVPFEGGRAGEGDGNAPFRFIVHLRLRRAVYAYPGIETRIVEKLTDLLGTHAGEARIHAGLGWSDLIVEGYFSPTEQSFRDLIRFIIQAHSLRLACGPEKNKTFLPVLQRILTVFGYREGTVPDFEASRVLTYLRGVPGGYAALIEELGKRAEADGSETTIDILDGKADFMVRTTRPPKGWLARQRELGSREFEETLRKVETHLMFFPAQEFYEYTRGANLDIDAGPEVLHDEKGCGCEASAKRIIDQIEQTMKDLRRGTAKQPLPIEHRYAVDNALFLLAAALRDSSICCDVRDAVLACLGGLQRILAEINAESKASPSSRYRQMWKRLDEWHRLGELLLRQRTVGSYEEILGQSDRSIVYSGGVQKFLYLADQLMKDFAKRVQPIGPPHFAAIYDSVKSIFSFYRSGALVRVPTSRIFGFPLIVPDLWHEVAAALFFIRHGEALARLVREDDERNHYVANIADHYADVIVYLHGFRGDFGRFLVSLVHGWKLSYRDVPDEVWRVSVGHFLLRAYLVYEFDRVREARRSRDPKEMQRFFEPAIAEELIPELKELLEPLLPKERRDQVGPEDWQLVHANSIKTTFSSYHRQLYWPFVDLQFPPREIDLAPFDEGTIADLSDADINALFGELAYRFARKDELSDEDFAASAALGESAAIEYHRRQMTRNDGGEGDGGR